MFVYPRRHASLVSSLALPLRLWRGDSIEPIAKRLAALESSRRPWQPSNAFALCMAHEGVSLTFLLAARFYRVVRSILKGLKLKAYRGRWTTARRGESQTDLGGSGAANTTANVRRAPSGPHPHTPNH